jgi:membrane-anchored mycosin MYCP
MSRAIALIGPNTVVVAAAGNHGGIEGMVDGFTKKSAVWPAALPDVVAVGAIDENGKARLFQP